MMKVWLSSMATVTGVQHKAGFSMDMSVMSNKPLVKDAEKLAKNSAMPTSESLHASDGFPTLSGWIPKSSWLPQLGATQDSSSWPSWWPIATNAFDQDDADGEAGDANGSVIFKKNDTTNTSSTKSDSGVVENFCRNGKLLPKMYLLGAPKCATTSFAQDMLQGGNNDGHMMNPAPRRGSDKEWHFWHKFSKDSNPVENRDIWLDELQECPTNGTLTLLADFNIHNLAAVPLPQNYDLGFCSCDDTFETEQTMDIESDVPTNLEVAYGDDAKQLTFVLMLREPLSRMQSAWYHAQYEDFMPYWGFTGCCSESFQKAIEAIVGVGANLDSEQPTFSRRLGGLGSVWTSLYGRHLEAFTKKFHHSQFVIVPYKQYFDGAKDDICADLSDRVGMRVCNKQGPVHGELVHPHPKLREDISDKMFETFQNMIHPENERLLQMLVNMSAQNATLAGYRGPPGNYTQIRTWLLDSW